MLDLYLNRPTLLCIYSYLNWYDLRHYDNAPDSLWKQICDYYCKDDLFEEIFESFWGSNALVICNSRDLFLYFINEKVRFINHHGAIASILLQDRDFIKIASRYGGTVFAYSSPAIRSDLQIVSEVIKEHPWAFKYVDISIKTNRNVVLNLLAINANIFEYLDPIYKADREIVLLAVRKNGSLLQHVNKTLQSDREIVLVSVKQKGDALQYADPVFFGDEEIALAALTENKNAVNYIDKLLTSNPAFMLEAIRCNPLISTRFLSNYPDFRLKAMKYRKWVID